MASLVSTVREKFLEAIRSVQPPGRWKALVVDAYSNKLLESVLKKPNERPGVIQDVLAENVTDIVDIASYRQAVPSLEAMYLLMPTTQNVERVIAEFSNGRQMYQRCHLFFIEGLGEDLFARITASPAMPFLACLTELYMNFWAVESQMFSLNEPNFFYSMYTPPPNPTSIEVRQARLRKDLYLASKMITNVCITLGEIPYVRYYVPTHHPPLGPLAPNAAALPPPLPEGSGRWRTNLARGAPAREYENAETEYVTKVLAWMVQQALDEYKNANPDFPKPSDPPRPRGTLLITDRSMDLVAPFVHEFTYQAMANDLLAIENGTKYKYKFQSSVGDYEDQIATLSDEDAVWTSVRHLHMRETIDKLMADFNKFIQDNAGFRQGEGAASVNDMKDMLASLPQFQEQREKFSLHLNMAEECMKLFEQQKLPAIASVEQNCATGLTAEGKTPKTLVEEMVPLLDSREISNEDKVRIIALYIQFRDGVPDEDRRRLSEHARLTMSGKEALNNLTHLGVRITRGSSDKDTKKKLKAKRISEEEYELSRFKPLLQTVIQDQAANKLDSNIFPYVKDSPANVTTSTSLRSNTPVQSTTSLRSAKPSWHRPARAGATTADVRERLIVFVAGGVTYSELRTAYQLSAPLAKDIYIGSTHTITPKGFMEDLKLLAFGGERDVSRALEVKHRTDQDYYDDKYYTKDEEQPTVRAPAASNSAGNRPVRPTASPADSSLSIQSTATGSSDKKKRRFLGFGR